MARKIMLDPGHGGVNPNTQGLKEPGIVSSGYYECIITLQTANRIKEFLERKYDVQVLMTRNDDTYLSLGARGQLAKDKGVELFVSIHYNGFNTEAFGYEDYVHTNANAKNITIQEKIHAPIKAFIEQNGLFDRGTKKEDFQVLRDTYATIPSILLEGLFIDNANDVAKLNNVKYLDGYANAVAEGIASALGLTKLTTQTADFGVEVSGLLVGQYDTLTQATAKVTELYNAGNTTQFGINAKAPAVIPTVAKQKNINFKGKTNGDGDKTREIWFTSDYSSDQPSENIKSEANSGYAGCAVASDGKYLALEVDGVVGKQVQFEFAFNLSELGKREEIANKLKSLKFKTIAGETLDFDVKVYKPISKTYTKLATYSGGKTYKVVDTDFLNVRNTPGGDLVGKLAGNDNVSVLGIDEFGWAKIKFNGGLAYCSSLYLSFVSGTSFIASPVVATLSTDLLQYVSESGIVRFGVTSVNKTVGQIPLVIEIDNVTLEVNYME